MKTICAKLKYCFHNHPRSVYSGTQHWDINCLPFDPCRRFARRAFVAYHHPNVKQFQPLELEKALTSVESHTEIKHIVVGPAQYKVSSEGHRIEHVAVDWDRCAVLRTLHSMQHIKSITVDMWHILDEAKLRYGYTPNYKCGLPDPILAFGDWHVGWEEPSLCTWTHPQYPKLLITHFPTLKMMDICHPFRFDRAGWKALVAANLDTPMYPAFDFTAEFHSKDLSGPERGGVDYGDEEFEDLRPLGSGWRYPSGGTFFEFAQDMITNMAYFSINPDAWKPDLYFCMMRHGSAESNLW